LPECIAHQLRNMLNAPDIAVHGGRIQDLTAPLFPEEEGCMARCAPKRRAEFVAGRTAARAALRQLGVQDQGIRPGPNRAPKWPDGLTGSITHDPSHCLAAVARKRHVRGIGIDIERRQCMPKAARDLFMSASDQGAIPGLSTPSSKDMPVTVFSAKESVFKALNPLMDILHDPHEFYIRFPAQPGVFTAHLSRDNPELGVVGRFVVKRDLVIT